MKLADRANFEEKKRVLKRYLSMRGEPDHLLDQRYIEFDSILHRLEILNDKGMLSRRIMSIGDDDFTGLSCAIFGEPLEVLIVDIDKRLSEILFEANLEDDLPIRFLYHDMRIKLIEILRAQYSLILIEPPWTSPGMEVFLSRAIESLTPNGRDGIFISLPKSLRSDFDRLREKLGIIILDEFKDVTRYEHSDETADFIQLMVPTDIKPSITEHWLDAFFHHEISAEIKPYRCKCENIIQTGPNSEIEDLERLKSVGCPSCGNTDIFVFASKIKME